ncbi:MAG: dockerin type I domain-containing protein [Planctomycetota bacterium]|nr:dockerin type I domain-containing protein [Planctomycetota bacterium]
MKNSNLKLGLESLESRKLCAVDLAADLPFECFADDTHAGDISAFAMVSPTIGETRRLAADVDGDGRVSPIDALRVIDALNRVGTSRPVSGGEGEQEPIGSLDTNSDGSLNPIDVLVVIDALNAFEGFEASAFQLFEATAYEEFEVTAVEDVEATAYETDVVFEEYDTEFDFSWVKRGGIDDEFPLFFDERFELFALEDFSEEFTGEFSEEFTEFTELYPVYAMMGAGSTGGMDVAMFSQNGPLGHVMRKNMSDNAELEPAVVSYFSSNFLRGSAR